LLASVWLNTGQPFFCDFRIQALSRTFLRTFLRQVHCRPRNRSSRPLTIDLRQISINSIDRLDFWPFSWLSSTRRHGDRLDRLDRLDTWFFVFA